MDHRDADKKIGTDSKSASEIKEIKLARQLRENLAKRKAQSRQRNTKPRKFKKTSG